MIVGHEKSNRSCQAWSGRPFRTSGLLVFAAAHLLGLAGCVSKSAGGNAPGTGGGSSATGGNSASGGSPGSGGSTATGGAGGSGGAASGTGGAASGSGGAPGSGGSVGAGGLVGSGGGAATGGTVGGSGGAAPRPDAAVDAPGGADGGVADAPSGEVATGADIVATIQNGIFWNDTTGKRIEAHGGGFTQVADTWYWIGEDKSANSGNFKAVNCYASKDLQHWEFRNAIITKSTAADLNTADRIIERPKVIYNDTTKKFVMWLHWDGANYAEAKAGVFTSATVDGSYTYVSSFQPNGNMSRDDTLFKDDDGKAYFISAANNNADMDVYQLSDDYLTVGKQIATLWAGSSREAPAMFKQGGRYYLITSAATGWDSNQAKYASATAIAGPWPALQNIGDGTTYDTQAAYVIPVVGTKATTFIYAGDRWQDPDLVSSKYIWFPIKFNGTAISMDEYDQWQLDLTTGQWSGAGGVGLLPQTGWSLLYADSEETSAEDGHAVNAFDGASSTIWHTQYTGSAPAHPHEIQIDLGATTTFAGFRYLPRQDKDDHGMVAQYAFYASSDSSNWGTALAAGTFGTSRAETRVMFAAAQTARYIRFVALSEINGQPWASVAELNLIAPTP